MGSMPLVWLAIEDDDDVSIKSLHEKRHVKQYLQINNKLPT